MAGWRRAEGVPMGRRGDLVGPKRLAKFGNPGSRQRGSSSPFLAVCRARRQQRAAMSKPLSCSYFYAEDIGVYASVEAQMVKPHILK